jgi:hypothetical protein
MTEQPPVPFTSRSRNVSLHFTENHFLVAVNKPFDEESVDYDRLNWLSKGVRYLGEGSQIFIYDRYSFGERTDEQRRELGRFVSSVTKPLGIIPEVATHPINVRTGNTHE